MKQPPVFTKAELFDCCIIRRVKHFSQFYTIFMKSIYFSRNITIGLAFKKLWNFLVNNFKIIFYNRVKTTTINVLYELFIYCVILGIIK